MSLQGVVTRTCSLKKNTASCRFLNLLILGVCVSVEVANVINFFSRMRKKFLEVEVILREIKMNTT